MIATNGLMRRGALIWDRTLKSSPPHKHDPQSIPLFSPKMARSPPNLEVFSPFLARSLSLPTFFAILRETSISRAVPVTKATTLATTAVFGMLLGEETRVGLALFDLMKRVVDWRCPDKLEIV
ncbi:hypothetical protein Acr_29g0001790 [Actinidia rufa]|uniref:Uncharacterized protein n=1 Tax=Actinidia rufa TaxID=165716 RepID=A0A7J0HD10_9ERIC|nr:hypothetical protein Acr_29g0001790 [Actinidia rufa]